MDSVSNCRMSLTSLHQRDDCRLSRKPRGSSDLLLTQCPLSFRKRTFDRNKCTGTTAQFTMLSPAPHLQSAEYDAFHSAPVHR